MLAIGTGKADDPCCFDLDGNDVRDNGLGKLLASLGSILGDTDVNAMINEHIQAGTIAVLLGENGLDSAELDLDLILSAYFGKDVDDLWENNLTGTGEFYVVSSNPALGAGAPFMTFKAAVILGGHLMAGPTSFSLPVPIDSSGLVVDLTVHQILLDADVAMSPANTGLDMTNGVLGGVVPMADVYSLFNGFLASSCACLGLGDEPLITYLGEGIKATCAKIDKTKNTCTDEDGSCNELGSFCGILLGLVQPDIDSDGTGIDDAMSFGICFEAVGAVIDGVDETSPSCSLTGCMSCSAVDPRADWAHGLLQILALALVLGVTRKLLA